MYFKIVYCTMTMDSKEVTFSVNVCCVPNTPDKELLDRARDLVRRATYEFSVVK